MSAPSRESRSPAPAARRPAAGPPAAARVETAYQGEVARDYLARRAGALKWRLEEVAVEELLAGLPRGTVLDVPAGTGRFLAAYARHGHRFVGVDASLDMLAQARAAPGAGGGPIGESTDGTGKGEPAHRLVQGLVGELPLADRSVDHVLCARLLNWFDRDELRRALAELRRVASGSLMIEVRLSAPLGWRRLPGLAGELLARPISSLRRLARALLPAKPGRPRLRFHDVGEFEELIAGLGLVVDRRLPILEGTAFSRRWLRHTPLAFFVLSRNDGEPSDS